LKLKIIVKIIEKLFGVVSDDENPRADLYLPDRLLAMSLVFLAIGISFGIYSVFRYSYWAIIAAICGIGLVFLLFYAGKTSASI